MIPLIKNLENFHFFSLPTMFSTPYMGKTYLWDDTTDA